MFETFNLSETTAPPTPLTAPAPRTPQLAPRAGPYRGPERRAVRRDNIMWMTRMLDEIDHGMLLVTGDAQVSYLNHAARVELNGQHALLMLGQSLRARHPQDVAPLYNALAAAERGLRKLIHLGSAEDRVSLSVVPLPGASQADGTTIDSLTLLVLSKRHFCEALSVQAFARSVNLTPAETRVLEMLCDGALPVQIAGQAGVAVSTVRSQIGSIRTKTGASSIRDLVRQVAVLPPMVGALRGGMQMGPS